MLPKSTYSTYETRESMINTGYKQFETTNSSLKKTAGQIHDDITNQKLLTRLECLTVGKYLTTFKHEKMVK